MKKILASFRRLAALPMHVHALVFGAFFISGSLSMSIPYLSFRVAETGNASSLVTGIVLASSAFVWSIVGFWTGGLSDRFGRRTLILTAMALSAAAYAGLGFASSIPAFLLLNASVGFAKALFDPSWQALLAEVTKPEDKPLVFSFRYLASNAGFAIGPIVSFWFQSANPASVFFVTAGVYVAFGIVLAKVLPAPKIISTARTIATRNDSRLSTLASNRSLLVHVVAGAAIAFVFSQIQSTLPLHLNRIIPNAVALYSLLLSVRGIATITLQLFAPAVLTRAGSRRTLAFGALLYAVGFLLFALGGGTVAVLVAGAVCCAAGEAISVPAGIDLVDSLAGSENKGRFLGAAQLKYLGFFIGPVVGGWLLDGFGGAKGPGGTVALFVCAAAALGASLLYWFGVERVRVQKFGALVETL